MTLRIVLAGAGHANIVAMRKLVSWRVEQDIFIVNDGPRAWYTGALPALIRGDIREDRAYVDVAALAKLEGLAFINAKITGFDGEWLMFEDHDPLRFDILSLSTGALPNGGVKPIGEFLQRLKTWELVEAPAIGIVGGGPAGVELALALRQRLGLGARIAICTPAENFLATAPERIRHRIRNEMAAQQIHVGDEFPFAVQETLKAYTPPPTIPIRETLQLTTHANIFATGDCAAFPTPIPRSGAIAVRQGKTLATNIIRKLSNQSLKTFSPPRNTLAILSLNNHTATAWYGPLSHTSHAAMALKKRLDANWVRP